MLYVVSSGYYEDWRIDGIFTNQENAEQYCFLHPHENQEIDEWTEDEIPTEHGYYKYWYVYKDRGKWRNFDEDNVEVEEVTWHGCGVQVVNNENYSAIKFYLGERNDEQAYKIIQNRIMFEEAYERGHRR